MLKLSVAALALCTPLLLVGSTAIADDGESMPSVELDSADDGSTLDWSAGIRTGGYGFRENVGSSLDWRDCRMDGIGAFSQVSWGGPLFAELSVDGYYAISSTLNGGMDRHSVLSQGALGLRVFEDNWVTPTMRVGGGVEWTHVEMEGMSTRAVQPIVFAGLGGEVQWRNLSFGIEVRGGTMAHPEHTHDAATMGQALQKHDEPGLAGGADGTVNPAAGLSEVPLSMEVFGQALFSLRYEI